MNAVLKVGDGVTKHIGSDLYPFSVIEVNSDTRVTIRSDHHRRLNDGSYSIFPNPNGNTAVITKHNDGIWRKLGEPKGSSFYTVLSRNAYFSPEF